VKRVDFAKGVARKIKKKEAEPKSGDTYMGIDWGMRNDPTVICFMWTTPDGPHYSHHEISNNDIQSQVESISAFIERHKPKGVVADIGFGAVQCQMLQQRHGEIVKTCYYRDNGNISYDANTRMLSVNREATLAESATLIKSPLTDSETHALNYANLALICSQGETLSHTNWVMVPGDTM
jgi:hypothetical protein